MLAVRVYRFGTVHLSVLCTKDSGRKLPTVLLCDDGDLRLSDHGKRMADQRLELAKSRYFADDRNHWDVPYSIRAEEIHQNQTGVGR